jgi:hypothetical protein
MTLSITEKLGMHAVDALHEAIGKAWQAGYDQAVKDLVTDKELGGGRTLHLSVVSELEVSDNE